MLRQHYFIILSSAFHIALLIFAGLYFTANHDMYEGQNNAIIISAFTANDNFFHANTVKKIAENSEKKLVLTKKTSDSRLRGNDASPKKSEGSRLRGNDASPKKTSDSRLRGNDKNSEKSSETRGGARTGNENNELLALLHEAIQQAQQYPLSAEELGRKGRVTIQFILKKDGSVNAVQIAKSSGTTSLDEAALAAVRDASPFKNIEKYVDSTQKYSVDVVFD